VGEEKRLPSLTFSQCHSSHSKSTHFLLFFFGGGGGGGERLLFFRRVFLEIDSSDISAEKS
jgi:hypothetical protein